MAGSSAESVTKEMPSAVEQGLKAAEKADKKKLKDQAEDAKGLLSLDLSRGGEVSLFDSWTGKVWGGGRKGRGCTHFVHGRSRMTIDPRIRTMPGRSTSGFHQPGRHCSHQARSAVRCSASCMKGELHPSKNRS